MHLFVTRKYLLFKLQMISIISIKESKSEIFLWGGPENHKIQYFLNVCIFVGKSFPKTSNLFPYHFLVKGKNQYGYKLSGSNTWRPKTKLRWLKNLHIMNTNCLHMLKINQVNIVLAIPLYFNNWLWSDCLITEIVQICRHVLTAKYSD